MKVAGRGRIIIWEGGSLWIMQALQAPGAALNATDFHAHHAIQVTLALDGRFRLRTPAQSLARDAAVAPDVAHVFAAAGLMALIFIEPESQSGRAIAKSLFEGRELVAVPRKLVGDLARQMRDHYRRPRVDERALEDLARQLVARLAGLAQAELPDPRVRKIMAYAAARLDGAVTLGAAARSAGLSAGRARHLFVEQTGLAFRKYLLWLRIMRAVAIFAGGASLTRAAHEAGFADSAHFSRTFRRMFGIAAASLQIA